MDPLFAATIVFLGLSFGSFLNVCIYRMPLGLSVSKHRSACPKCKHSIAFYDNVPVFSWLSLRGRCRHCQAKITPRYLFIEVLTAALFFACYWYFGLTIATFEPTGGLSIEVSLNAVALVGGMATCAEAGRIEATTNTIARRFIVQPF